MSVSCFSFRRCCSWGAECPPPDSLSIFSHEWLEFMRYFLHCHPIRQEKHIWVSTAAPFAVMVSGGDRSLRFWDGRCEPWGAKRQSGPAAERAI